MIRRQIKILFYAVTLGSGLIPQAAHSYPEMVRNGYSNCTVCHVSPNGGGVLTEYGRELSRELLSTWRDNSENSKEHQFAYGVVTVADWLKMGGDVRSVYAFQDDQYRTNGKTILMQADLEAAATYNRFTLDATFGYRDSRGSSQFADMSQSRRHYLMYTVSDTWSIRAGRFLSSYGINTPDHVSVTKRSLGLGQGFESYNLEASYIAEKLNVYLTGDFGRPDDSTLDRDTGAMAQVSYLFGERYKAGVNFYSGKNSVRARNMFGVFGLLGLSQKWVLLTEADFQYASVSGAATTQKLSYEAFSGGWVFLSQEYLKLNFDDDLTKVNVYGLGVQLFPRVHFEFNLTWNWKRDYSYSDQYFSYAWLMTHFYL